MSAGVESVKVVRQIEVTVKLTKDDFKFLSGGDQEMWVKKGRPYKSSFSVLIKPSSDDGKPDSFILTLSAIHKEIRKNETTFTAKDIEKKIDSYLGDGETFNQFENGDPLSGGRVSDVAVGRRSGYPNMSFEGEDIIRRVYSRFDGPDDRDLRWQYVEADLLIEYSFTS